MIVIDTPYGEVLFIGVASLFCLFLINILVLAKFSFARLREDHINDLDSLSDGAKNFLRKLYIKPALFINTCQFFIIFLILIMGLLVGPYLSSLIESQLLLAVWDSIMWQYAVDVIILLLITTVVLIFGEIIPKALGLSFPEQYITFSARLIVNVGFIIRPFVFLAEKISNLFLEPMQTPFHTEVDLVHNEDEIRIMVNRSHLEGAIDKVEGELIDNVFDFVDRLAKEVMIPRQDVHCLYIGDSFEENMDTVRETSHTRYPVCVEDKDHIIGLIHIKDLMDRPEEAEKDLHNILRNILVVPEVMKLSVLLQYMRTRRIYQAVVVDEYGGMVGLVGLEDIIEELVGDIQDEHESPALSVVTNEDGTFEFDGKVLVVEVERTMDVEIDDADEDTIGGYIFGLLERTPVVGDKVTASGYEFEVTEVQGYRISRLKVTPSILEEETELSEEETVADE